MKCDVCGGTRGATCEYYDEKYGRGEWSENYGCRLCGSPMTYLEYRMYNDNVCKSCIMSRRARH